jgi:hypothetical protein
VLYTLALVAFFVGKTVPQGAMANRLSENLASSVILVKWDIHFDSNFGIIELGDYHDTPQALRWVLAPEDAPPVRRGPITATPIQDDWRRRSAVVKYLKGLVRDYWSEGGSQKGSSTLERSLQSHGPCGLLFYFI